MVTSPTEGDTYGAQTAFLLNNDKGYDIADHLQLVVAERFRDIGAVTESLDKTIIVLDI